MSNYFEVLLKPAEYIRAGDVLISRPPLINTSYSELADSGWNCLIVSRHLPSIGKSKTSISFRPPGGGTSGINFKICDYARIYSVDSAIRYLSDLDACWLEQPKNLSRDASTIRIVDERRPIEVTRAGVDRNTFAPQVDVSVPIRMSYELFKNLVAANGSKEEADLFITAMANGNFKDGIELVRTDGSTVENENSFLAERVPMIDMIMDHPDLEMFESEILQRINDRRGQRIKAAPIELRDELPPIEDIVLPEFAVANDNDWNAFIDRMVAANQKVLATAK